MHRLPWRCDEFFDAGCYLRLLVSSSCRITSQQNIFRVSSRSFPLYSYAIPPKTVPGTFQRRMDIILYLLKWQFALVYLNDIVIISKSPDEHIDHVLEFLTFVFCRFLQNVARIAAPLNRNLPKDEQRVYTKLSDEKLEALKTLE